MQRGFSLIETLLYIALFSILMGGAAVAMYSLFESRGHNQTKAVMQEEGDFLIGKINWTVSGSSAITSPGVGTTCVTPAPCALSVVKWDTGIGSASVALSGTEMTIARGAQAPQGISNSNVAVSNLSVSHFYAGGTNPEGVRVSFTLTGRTDDGKLISQDFSTTNYLRR